MFDKFAKGTDQKTLVSQSDTFAIPLLTAAPPPEVRGGLHRRNPNRFNQLSIEKHIVKKEFPQRPGLLCRRENMKIFSADTCHKKIQCAPNSVRNAMWQDGGREWPLPGNKRPGELCEDVAARCAPPHCEINAAPACRQRQSIDKLSANYRQLGGQLSKARQTLGLSLNK